MWNAPTTTVITVNRVISPLDEQWELDARGYSSGLGYQLVWLSGLVPFAQVQQIIADVGQNAVNKTVIWEQAQAHANRLHKRSKRHKSKSVWSARAGSISAMTHS